MNTLPTSRPTPAWLPAAALAACAALVLIACGGGGSGGTQAASGASTFSSGPITGFGSVIVNGVRFDDSKARIADDDGNARTSGDLKLGMVAEVHGGAKTVDDKGAHCIADDVVFRSELVGPIESVDAAAQTFVALGQGVQVGPTTVFDDRLGNGFAALQVGAIVEVYGQLDSASGRIAATRIEPKAAPNVFKVRGPVSQLDAAAQTFRINGALFSFAGLAASQLGTPPVDGQIVRVKVQTTPVAGGWVVTQLRSGVRRIEDRDEAELKGRITALTSPTSFSVDGIAVDASGASFPEGRDGIVLGARVEVEGTASSGTIVASKVSVESQDDARRGEVELHGAVGALDVAAKTFTLRGLTVNFDVAGLVFKDGSAATLADGVQVEVKGALSPDGIRVDATRIEFER